VSLDPGYMCLSVFIVTYYLTYQEGFVMISKTTGNL
jgi:hypothetical protein